MAVAAAAEYRRHQRKQKPALLLCTAMFRPRKRSPVPVRRSLARHRLRDLGPALRSVPGASPVKTGDPDPHQQGLRAALLQLNQLLIDLPPDPAASRPDPARDRAQLRGARPLL